MVLNRIFEEKSFCVNFNAKRISLILSCIVSFPSFHFVLYSTIELLSRKILNFFKKVIDKIRLAMYNIFEKIDRRRGGVKMEEKLRKIFEQLTEQNKNTMIMLARGMLVAQQNKK